MFIVDAPNHQLYYYQLYFSNADILAKTQVD